MHFIDVATSEQAEQYNSLLDGRTAMVMFYMDGCMYCEQLKPEWKAFNAALKSKYGNKKDSSLDMNMDSYIIASVNSSMLSEIKGDKDVNGYPTILLLVDGNKKVEFNGERTKDGLMKFFNTHKAQSGGRRRRRIATATHKKRRNHTSKKRSAYKARGKAHSKAHSKAKGSRARKQSRKQSQRRARKQSRTYTQKRK